MSYTEIYKFNKEGNAQRFAETKNAFRGAMAVWQIVEKRYLPKYVPAWAGMMSGNHEYSRVSDFSGQAIKEIWNLIDSESVSETDKIVLGSTFDKVIVLREDVPKLIQAFREFEGETSLKEQADYIEKELNADEDLVAIAWNQTSVNGDMWETYEEEKGSRPYNMLSDTGHWSLFTKEEE
jgi:hypothetical protein